jgi:hypothetical protein
MRDKNHDAVAIYFLSGRNFLMIIFDFDVLYAGKSGVVKSLSSMSSVNNNTYLCPYTALCCLDFRFVTTGTVNSETHSR